MSARRNLSGAKESYWVIWLALLAAGAAGAQTMTGNA